MGLFSYFQMIVGIPPSGFEWLPYIIACLFLYIFIQIAIEFLSLVFCMLFKNF